MKNPQSRFQGRSPGSYEEFDILNTPLEGTHLVEANAGTGKTYALSGLFLRLILERGLSPAEILVVTYTRAATQELRERIRAMICDVVDFLVRDREPDPFLQQLIERQPDRGRCSYFLTQALRGLDEAAVFTVHGFCQHLLQEHAFETGSLFNMELVNDEEFMEQEIVEDFWRNQVCRAAPEFVHYLLHRKVFPETLLQTIRPALKHLQIRVIPQNPPTDLKSLDRYRRTLDGLRALWEGEGARDEVKVLLMDPGIKGYSYGTTLSRAGMSSPREQIVQAMLAAMDYFLLAPFPVFPPFQDVEKFSWKKLGDSMKKGCSPPQHAFFVYCDRLLEQRDALLEEMDHYLISLQGDLFRYTREERFTRKTRLNIRSYNDLLTDTFAALETRGSESFMGAAREKYHAALIDEFQDTDPVQYRIFDTLFGAGKTPLFFIGDPKQAIYGFRGADVVTYLKAAETVSDIYTLRQNWRSEPGLVRAVNTLFSGISAPFVHRNISYSPSEATENGGKEPLWIEEDYGAPLRIWLVDQSEEEDGAAPVAKNKAFPVILKAVAAEIARLVHLGGTGKAGIGDEPLSEKHLAVLVRKNRDARCIQESLRSFKVPSVLYNAGNVFETREAGEILRIMQAVAEPDHEGRIRAALATRVMGMNGEEMESLLQQEEPWEVRVFDFKEYHHLWEEKGFIPMFRRILSREQVRSRLVAFPDGERTLTNLLHLGEILHRVGLEQRLGLNALTKWLSCRIEDPSQGSEEHLLRLESDEEAVKIVTIHKSKGLEYPIVFCPFLWDGRQPVGSETVYHEKDENQQLTLDLGSCERDTHREMAREEMLAEHIRLLYVALTRAKKRCYMVWGRIRDADTSALAYILHSRDAGETEPAVKRARAAFQSLTRERMADDLTRLVRDSKGTITVETLPREKGPVPERGTEKLHPLSCRTFSGRIATDWKIASFSSLTSNRGPRVELPDYDAFPPGAGPGEEDGEEPTPEPPAGIFGFPRGARAGTCLHDILEHLDFKEKRREIIRALAGKKLEVYGFEARWIDAVDEMLEKVLSGPLDPTTPDLNLQKIGMKDRLNELEFTFPLKKIAPDVLNDLISVPGGPESSGAIPETMGRLHFAPLRGFLKGFMDLVFHWNGRFYLVDWKSNFLGDRVEKYGEDGLRKAMNEGYYHLQYHLYALALDRYLGLRLPGYRYEERFGGVFYVFLRGVDPDRGPDFGIFRDRPTPALIAAMREALIALPN